MYLRNTKFLVFFSFVFLLSKQKAKFVCLCDRSCKYTSSISARINGNPAVCNLWSVYDGVTMYNPNAVSTAGF